MEYANTIKALINEQKQIQTMIDRYNEQPSELMANIIIDRYQLSFEKVLEICLECLGKTHYASKMIMEQNKALVKIIGSIGIQATCEGQKQ